MIALPYELKMLITFLVTQGIKSIANVFGKKVGGHGAAFVAVGVGAIIFFVEGILALVPVDKREAVEAGLSFVAVILGSFGTHYTYKNISA